MVVVETVSGKSAAERGVEVVERKGRGHPDTICDSIVESISVALSSEYIKLFGTVLHHNIDKGLLAAGKAENDFGGGKVIRPMELIIGDRATFSSGKRTVPVEDIAIGTAKEWIRKNLRFVDPEKHLKYRTVLAPGSEEISGIFSGPGGIRAANDTSAAIGYFPLSPTEIVVLELEQYLNSEQFKKRYPETGEDIKVMALRHERDLELTIAMPFISGFISSEDDYFERKAIIGDAITGFVSRYDAFDKISSKLNGLDRRGRGVAGTYLSVLGTSAEDADSGQVGRGNRVNGLISICRPLGTEATAGKNPVSHVGKIYNVLAHKTAEKIYKNIEEIKEVYVLLLSRIGDPVDKPLLVSVQVVPEKGESLRDVSERVRLIVGAELSDMQGFCERLAAGAYPVC